MCPFYINTGMFEGVTTKFPRLSPILEENHVASNVLDSIESGREQLVMPSLVRLLPAMRLLPTRTFDRVLDFLGLKQNHPHHFTGRRPVSPEPNTASPAAELNSVEGAATHP